MSPDLREMPIRAVDCLKYIYKLREQGERVSTSTMRERLGLLEPSGQLSDATVSQLFKWLAEKEYVVHTPYHGVELTETGERAAAELVRHHRLLELFLFTIMGFALDEVDAEAERMEHTISEAFEDRMDELLGYPTQDPHGDPIPSRSGAVVHVATQPLCDLELGQQAVVRRVSDGDAGKLKYLTTLGLIPGASVSVRAREPFGGPLRVHVGRPDNGEEHALGPQLAREVQVSVVSR